jgi:glycine/D-amino acid oxidase-like deaminating enzyme
MRWANRAIARWKSWDDEWGKDLKMRLFFTTGDFIFRNDWENYTRTTRDLFVKVGVRHEVVPVADVRKAYPVIDLTGITVCLHEPDAGVVRARRSTQCVAEVFMKLGGDLMTIRAYPALVRDGRMDDLILSNRETVNAQHYVFALGPWMPKAFPGLMGPRMRTPIGQVSYFATPIADERFTYPNLPSFNFPGVTGWPTLPYDSRGFRVRGGANPGGGGGGGGGGGRGGGRGGGEGRGGGGGGGQVGGGQVGGPQQDPDLSARFVDLDSQARSRAFVAERFPLLKNLPINETRACHYEQSISRNFIIDKHPEMSNVWLAGGGSAEGFKFGPVVGEYVARRVLGKDLEPELAAAFRMPTETYDDPPVVAGGGGGRQGGDD